MKSVYAITFVIMSMAFGSTRHANAQDTLAQEYKPNNPDTSSELERSWVLAAKQFESAKAALIANGKIVVKRDSPPPLDQEGSLEQAGVHKNQMAATVKAQSECGVRIVVPENAGYGGADCWDNKGAGIDAVYGLVGSVRPNFNKLLVYGHQITEVVPRAGYKYDDYYIRSSFYIHDHESFEQSLLKSAQLGADSKGLFMNWQMTPMGRTDPAISTYVREKVSGGTQMLIGKAVWANRYRGKINYATCIYSLHGHVTRSTEALVCFHDVKGKSFTNKYVEEYMKVLDSIRLAP